MSELNLNFTFDDLFNELKMSFSDEINVSKGTPIQCTSKGTVYATIKNSVPLIDISSRENIHKIIKGMVTRATDNFIGDSIVIRALEVGIENDCVLFWVRACKEDSSLPDIYEKKSDGYGLINE